jgi:hypothetical protein
MFSKEKFKVIYKIQKQSKYKSKTKELTFDNIVRTIYNFRNIIKANEHIFVSFITLTFKDNITDLAEAQLLFKNYIRQVKRYIENNYIDFDLKYVCVPEFQKNGRVHFHLMTNLKLDTDLIPKRKVKKTYTKNKDIKELYYYDLKYWSYGYSLALDINLIDNVSKYMIMYLVKEKDNRYYGFRKYYTSNNLQKPQTVFFNGNEKEAIPLINILNYDKQYERIYTDNKQLNRKLKDITKDYNVKMINDFYNNYNGQVIQYQEFKKRR